MSSPTSAPAATTTAVIAVHADEKKDISAVSVATKGQPDVTHTSTPIHLPRLFLYFSLFLVPQVISITTLASNSMWHATYSSTTPSSNPMTANGIITAEEYIGLFSICTGSPVGDCAPIAGLCGAAAGVVNPLVLNVDDALCGSERKAAAAMVVLAVIAGFACMLSYLDNFLVWTNHSIWYKPRDHTVTQTSRVRESFREAILICAGLHALFLLIALALVADLKGKIYQPLTVEMYWGLPLILSAVVLDALFVGFFYFFDARTFFSLPKGVKFDPLDV
ncbi:hypothetical protein HK101_012004 [Irineochytrium annulatum]|nr:hypothetical protein HK101_012004 [Irineochytrium annulatum]